LKNKLTLLGAANQQPFESSVTASELCKNVNGFVCQTSFVYRTVSPLLKFLTN